MADDILKTPYQTYHSKSYPSLDPTQPSLSTKGKSAVLTGAGSGIGAAIAVSLARSGVSHLALVGRRLHALQKTKSAIAALTPDTQVSLYAVDITDASALDAVLAAFAGQTARSSIDILIANAGSLGPLSPIQTADPAAWWAGFEVNVKGNFHLLQAFLPRAAPDAAVVYVSSAVVHGPYMPNESSYCASKAGATKLFQYVHHEHPNLSVISVQPGLIADTDMMAGFENIAKGLGVDLKDLPWDDPALPGDFVVWAVSPEARFLNGRFVWVNWDVDELKADKEALLADPTKFTLGLL